MEDVLHVRRRDKNGAEIDGLEELMRNKLKARATVVVLEKEVLMRAIGQVLGKRHVHVQVNDKLDMGQFTDVWQSLGVPLGAQQVAQIYHKYGHDSHGRMPVQPFVEGLLAGASRLLMMGAGIQRRPYQRDRPATHMGKIIYPQCRKGVFPPSDWDPRLAKRSQKLPDVRLQLEFVSGYDGKFTTSPNLFYTATQEVVYYAAAVGVVYDKASHSQRFFMGHDDDIMSLSLHPEKNLVVTGQVGKNPCIIIWDTRDCREQQRIYLGAGNRGVIACEFSPSGTKVVAIATDNNHTMYIYDWQKKTKLLERKSQPGAPPTVYGVEWSPFESQRLVTFGTNHIKFWTLSKGPNGLEIKPLAGSYGKQKTHTIFSAAFLPSGLVLTGNTDGNICVWRREKCVRQVDAHARGPQIQRFDGKKTYNGVRVLRLRDDNKVLLSGGGDGYVIRWDVSNGDLGPPLSKIPIVLPEQMGTTPPPLLRALDSFPGSDVFIAGTSSCDVWEVDADPEMLVFGHKADLYGLAMNPAFAHIYASIAESETVTIWNANTRKPIKIMNMGIKARSAAFTPDGARLAVGMMAGGLKVMEFYPEVQQVAWSQVCDSHSVDTLAYSPNGAMLAAGCHDQIIYVLDVKSGYKKVCKCVGHSSAVKHIDWSVDARLLQSVCQAYELLYFDARSGRQIKENQRDARWQTFTCTQGFPVMGIWPKDVGADCTDINSADRSPTGKYVVTADDFGKVKVFNHPCVIEDAPAHVHGGHSSHVMNVRWSADEGRVLSVGGKDRCVFQWRVVKPAPRPSPHAVNAPWAAGDAAGLHYGMRR